MTDNNNNNQINNPSSYINNIQNNNLSNNTQFPFRLFTQNIQGLNDPTKQKQIVDLMDLYHIDIFGLSETKLSPTSSKNIYKTNDRYNAFFHNIATSPHAGVGILISKEYSKFIHKVKFFSGRVIYIDLFMQGRIKLRIIQVYINSNPADKVDIIKLHKDISKIIGEAQKDHYKVIIMGDF